MAVSLDSLGVPIATLTTISGIVHFFTKKAFSLWIESERAFLSKSLPVPGPPHINEELVQTAEDKALAPGGSDGKTGNNVMRSAVLVYRFEGCTAEEWAMFARHKAVIASHVCRENGELKSKLNGQS